MATDLKKPVTYVLRGCNVGSEHHAGPRGDHRPRGV